MKEGLKSKLISTGVAVPKFRYNQSDLADWMHQRLDAEDDKLARKFQILYKKTSIDQRHSVLPDFKGEVNNPVLFKGDLIEPKVEDRLAIYQKEVIDLALEAANECIEGFDKKEITHLITVSCTGMSAPGIELQLKQALGLNEEVHCHAVNFVGCYAAFPAIKMADSFCKADKHAKVLVIAVELCTLHFQNKETEDHLLSNALFSDGAGAVLITSETTTESGLLIDQFAGKLIPKGNQDMAWNIHSEGFLMKLTSYVPDLVDEGIRDLLEHLLLRGQLTIEEVQHWAIHPGGRKILEVCQKELELENGALDFSYDILKNYGNMSAPTIIFILDKMIKASVMNSGENLFACGFGPGLTLESILFKVA